MTEQSNPYAPSRRLSAAGVTPKPDIHLLGCDCPACEPYVPSLPRFADAAWLTLAAMIAGMGTGVVGVALYDWATAGPGLGAVFGL